MSVMPEQLFAAMQYQFGIMGSVVAQQYTDTLLLLLFHCY